MGVTKRTIQPGDGVNFPKPGDKLTMHYTWVRSFVVGFLFIDHVDADDDDDDDGCSGTLASNGSTFDSSHKRGRPFQFTIGIGQVIRGWDEGVMQMSIGEKAILGITSDYGYGSRGAGGVIPPNADLNFEVELLRIN